MSGSYNRLAAIRDYWMPRDPDARAEVRVTDIDEILRETVRLAKQRDALLEALKLALRSHGVMLMSDPPKDAWKTYQVEERAREAIKLVEGEKE